MDAPRARDSRPVIWACRLMIAGFLALVAYQYFTRKTADWDVVYLSAANHLRAHGDVFDGTNGYTYPPFGALFAVPFTLVPPLAATIAFAALNVACALVVFVGAWRLAGGRGSPGRAGTGAVDVAAFWFGALLVVGFVLDTAANRQTDLVIAAVIVAGGLLLARGRSVPAGLAFGVAAAFKCTPLLFAPYLAWKRRFVAAGAVAVAAVGLNLLPDVVYPPADGKARLVVWKDRFLSPMSDANRDPGQWASAVGFNHSLAGINLRLLAYERTGDPSQPVVPKAERPTARELKLINLGCVALMGVVALAAFWRKSGTVEPGPVLAAELGVVCTLMLLLSPMSSKPHFTPLLLAQLVIVRVGFAQRDRVLIGLAALVAVGGLCTGKDIVGKTVYELLMWNGLLFGLTLALFLGCCRARVLASRTGQATGIAPIPVVAGVRRAA